MSYHYHNQQNHHNPYNQNQYGHHGHNNNHHNGNPNHPNYQHPNAQSQLNHWINPPMLMAMVSIAPTPKPLSATEVIKQYIAEVDKMKENEVKKEIDYAAYNIKKCDLHPKKPSSNCRTCKKNKETIEEIDKKNAEQKEESDDEDEDDKLRVEMTLHFPIWGDATTCNLNPLLRNNILSAQYFKELYALKTYHEVIDEISKRSTHVEPWASGTSAGCPSTSFCCLYKFMLMRLTNAQLKGLLEYKGCPLVRCIGLLFVRYCCDPANLWGWLNKYLLDDEEVRPSADPNKVMTIGEFVEEILTNLEFYQTRFPRIPLKIDRVLQASLLKMREKRERKSENLKRISEFVKGALVKAISSYDGEFHDAEVDHVEGKMITVKFFDNTENQNIEELDEVQKLMQLEKQFNCQEEFIGGEEVVHIWDLRLYTEDEIEEFNHKQKKKENKSRSESNSRSEKKKSKKKHSKKRRDHSRSTSRHRSKKKRSRSRDRRSRSRSRDRRSRSKSPGKIIRDKKDRESRKKHEIIYKKGFMEEVKRRQQNNALANSKADYAKRPTSYKTSLSNPLPSGTYRNRSRSPSPIKREIYMETKVSRDKQEYKETKTVPAHSREHAKKMMEIRAKYGDAAANSNMSKYDNASSKKNKGLDNDVEHFRLG